MLGIKPLVLYFKRDNSLTVIICHRSAFYNKIVAQFVLERGYSGCPFLVHFVSVIYSARKSHVCKMTALYRLCELIVSPFAVVTHICVAVAGLADGGKLCFICRSKIFFAALYAHKPVTSQCHTQ